MDWTPRTTLGKQVARGEVKDIATVFREGMKIREPEIVDALLPNLKSEVILFGGSPGKGGGVKRTTTRRTVRMHRSGRRFNISALVLVGAPGYVGYGKASSNEHRVAIDKAVQAAKLNLIPVRRGCGSWECSCNHSHSIPMKAIGKAGAVKVILLPAPKGVGLCIGEEGKKVMRLCGIRDLWIKVIGDTRTRMNYVVAIIDSFKNLNKTRANFPEVSDGKEIVEIISEETGASTEEGAPVVQEVGENG